MSQEQSKDMSQYFFRASAVDFRKVPSAPVAYWMTPNMRDLFDSLPPVSEKIEVTGGMTTADNDRFLRLWHEVSIANTCFDAETREEAQESRKKWFPYNKGGSYRKWFGNRDFVVNWKNDGEEILSTGKAFPRSKSFYFKESLTYTATSSSYFGIRYSDSGFLFDAKGSSCFSDGHNLLVGLGFLCSKIASYLLQTINPTIEFQTGNLAILPFDNSVNVKSFVNQLVNISRLDWDSYEDSWSFKKSPLISFAYQSKSNSSAYKLLREHWTKNIGEMQRLERENNHGFIYAYGLQNELTPDVSLQEITLSCNPHYRYGGNRSEEELETLLQCDTLRELVSYAIGCMMGRYSLDKPGLILATQGETLQDYLSQIPTPRFVPDHDAILPLTDQEWFTDDATNRFREFIRVVWGDENLQQNLDFVAESLCLHAIKPKRGESALDTIRRYLSTQFFKDHLRTYKKRPVYWLFSSGRHKAFECLVYLHRYHEGTLARMRTEYVIPLTAKLNSYAEKLEQDRDASTSAAETKRLTAELTTLHKQQAELAEFDEKLRHYADQRISLDLDDGVKVNYGKFGDLLAEVKLVTGAKE